MNYREALLVLDTVERLGYPTIKEVAESLPDLGKRTTLSVILSTLTFGGYLIKDRDCEDHYHRFIRTDKDPAPLLRSAFHD